MELPAAEQMNATPFSHFSGLCRCHRLTDLGPLGERAYRLAIAGHFQRRNGGELESERRSLGDLGVDYVFRPSIGARRYADWFASRERYYTLTHDVLGNDWGTLAREIQAYSDPVTRGNISVIDHPLPESKNEIERLLGHADAPAVSLNFVSLPAHPNPCVLRLIDAGIIPADFLSQTVVRVLLPTRLRRCHFEKVIDLRKPETREWLIRVLQGDSKQSGIEVIGDWAPKGLTSFELLMPTLMFPELGGNDFTTLLGTWFVSLGADALIYPSARSNARVEIEHGELKTTYGWNLLDYSDYPSTNIRPVSFGVDFEHRVASANIRFYEEKQDPRWIGSLAVIGVEDTLETIRRRKVDTHYELSLFKSRLQGALERGDLSLESSLHEVDPPAGIAGEVIKGIATVGAYLERMAIDDSESEGPRGKPRS